MAASEILSVEILNARGEEAHTVASGEPMTVRVRSRFHQAKSDPMVGILIRTRIGMDVYGTNTSLENARLGDFEAGDELEVDFRLESLAYAANLHIDRGHPERRRHQPRLAGRRHRLRCGGYARGRRRGQPEGQSGMARITVKVHPRARRSAIAGRLGEAWKLDLAAPPVDGKANEECIRFFAELAGVPRSRVRIVTGATGRHEGGGDRGCCAGCPGREVPAGLRAGCGLMPATPEKPSEEPSKRPIT